MTEEARHSRQSGGAVQDADLVGLPLPTQRFRRQAWFAFERALDPLAPPKPLPPAEIRPPPREDGSD